MDLPLETAFVGVKNTRLDTTQKKSKHHFFVYYEVGFCGPSLDTHWRYSNSQQIQKN